MYVINHCVFDQLFAKYGLTYCIMAKHFSSSIKSGKNRLFVCSSHAISFHIVAIKQSSSKRMLVHNLSSGHRRNKRLVTMHWPLWELSQHRKTDTTFCEWGVRVSCAGNAVAIFREHNVFIRFTLFLNAFCFHNVLCKNKMYKLLL